MTEFKDLNAIMSFVEAKARWAVSRDLNMAPWVFVVTPKAVNLMAFEDEVTDESKAKSCEVIPHETRR
jgi:hypothetical protein